jgi:hypothetical protein
MLTIETARVFEPLLKPSLNSTPSLAPSRPFASRQVHSSAFLDVLIKKSSASSDARLSAQVALEMAITSSEFVNITTPGFR